MLPEIEVPIYSLTQPSTGKILKFKPFLVRQEKLLLMASSSNDETEMVDTILQMIDSQFVEKIPLDKLPIFDIEFFFINMRAKSIGGSVDQTYKCSNTLEDGTACDNKIPITLSMDDVVIENLDSIKNNKIMLTESTGVMMKPPPYTILKKITDESTDDVTSLIFLRNCMESIFNKETVYLIKDNTDAELTTFLDSLTKENFDKLQNYVDNLPYVAIKKKIKCDKCGFEHDITIKEPLDFF